MFLRLLSFIFGCIACVFLISCGGKQDDSSITDGGPFENEWSDSIYGTLSEEEQYYQHLIIEIPSAYQLKIDSLTEWIIDVQPGALKFKDWNPDSISLVKTALDTAQIIQPFIYCNYFDFLQISPYPYWESNKNNRAPRLSRIFQKSRMNLLDFDYSMNMNRETIEWLDTLQNTQTIFPVIAHYTDKKVKEQFNEFIRVLQRFDYNVYVNISSYDTIKFETYRMQTDYQGLFMVNTATSSINNLLAGGADLAFKNIESGDIYSNWKGSTDEFVSSTKRILNFKSKVDNRMKEQHLEAEMTFTQLNLIHNSVALISDKSKMLPLTSRFSFYSEKKLRVRNKTRKEVNVSMKKIEMTLKEIERIGKGNGKKVVLLSDSLTSEMMEFVNYVDKSENILFCFSNPDNFEFLEGTPNLLFVPSLEQFSTEILLQQLSKRINLNGDFVLGDSIYKGLRHKKTLLARTIPEYVGLDMDTLSRINWAINGAMNGRAFPGCQVLLAKNGCIIYDQQFGHHSYKREKPVTDESLYDLASITKVLATTVVGMKLWELGKFGLKDSLKDFISDTIRQYLPYPSTIRNITFHQLFIHESGLPAGFPLIRYLNYKSEDVGVYDKYYCDISDSTFKLEVAENFYLEQEYADSMWIKLNLMWLDNSKPYKYSDVNMNTLYYMFKSIIENDPRSFGFNESKKDLEGRNLYLEYLYKTIYEPLGMEHTLFKPLKRYGKMKIVPTENDTYWRKQLLQGHVHDPNSALMGGVAGNAGLFSTTNDMAVLCQMLLNKGMYNGKRYFNIETINKFTTQAENSHRGLGFNKRTISTTGFGMADSSSLATYGHTGFTGTCFWIDPEEDLVYIFLSNRVHPTVNNRIYQFGIRKRVHNAAYDARLNY
jgi:CubicO group peptidase (beta-lactamase class C family)